jgi:hypothetical protein
LTAVLKGKMSKEVRDATLGRIKKSTDIKDMASADYVVEAATEKEDLKFGISKIWTAYAGRRYPCHKTHPPYNRQDRRKDNRPDRVICCIS